MSDLKYNGKINWLIYILVTIVVSCYYFPFGFSFLPEAINSKIILASLGIVFLAFNLLKSREVLISHSFVSILLIVVLFSLVGYISLDINNSSDTAYANYFISFSTWILGALATCFIIKFVHRKIDIPLVINYLAVVCVAQCILALFIDNIPEFKFLVDNYVRQDTVASVQFLNDIDRLYGIGAALDVAGTRFSIVLIGLVSLIFDRNQSQRNIILYWLAFIIITLIGNMIARTTIVGVGLAFLYIILSNIGLNQFISLKRVNTWTIILSITLISFLVSVYLYHTNDEFYSLSRFAFEGFFNWIEKGEWKTDSTDRLNSVMWIWPHASDIQTWLIGKGVFSNWEEVGTDIGYCRFVFYNGLIGLSIFSAFFVVNAYLCSRYFPKYRLLFLLILVLGFVIWIKVSTDLFLIYALFYCIYYLKDPQLSNSPSN